MDGLKLDPSYFFAPYEGEQDHRLHLLSAKRDEKRVSTIESRMDSLETREAARDTEFAKLKESLVEKDQEIKRLRAELARRPRPTLRS
jgi:septal ring factor EnvC (AmiA/AmiB activator)